MWLRGVDARLPLDSLLVVHVTILVATFIFIGFAQVILAAGEPDPRRDLQRYFSRIDAQGMLAKATTVAIAATIGALVTILFAILGNPIGNPVSAALAVTELGGLIALVWHSYRVFS